MIKKLNRMTNAEWLTYCCDYLHPVVQVLIIEAINRYVDDILADKEQMLKDKNLRSFITPGAIIQSAKQLKEALNKKHE